jgi:XTP/dITP diphosphohydrolase
VKLLVATRSRGKQPELRRLLAPLAVDVVFPGDIGLEETSQEAELEVHDTFEANAKAKARYFARQSGLPTIADDSGLEVDALGGAPGVHSKRFAGHDGPDHEVTSANNAELLRRLAGLPPERRGARYRCALVLSPPPQAVGEGSLGLHRELVVTGVTEGRILTAPEGRGGFGYDPLFWSQDLGKSFGRATAEEKAAVSHRGRAVQALIAALTR